MLQAIGVKNEDPRPWRRGPRVVLSDFSPYQIERAVLNTGFPISIYIPSLVLPEIGMYELLTTRGRRCPLPE